VMMYLRHIIEQHNVERQHKNRQHRHVSMMMISA
jgi:hypothetical protein